MYIVPQIANRLAAWTLAAAGKARAACLVDSVELKAPETIQDPELVKFWTNVQRDLQRACAFLGEHRTAISVFGSARSPEGSEDMELAEAVGAAIAEAGADALGGGGPGVMLGAPRGHQQKVVELARARAPRTLAVGLSALPNEQRINGSVQSSATLTEFMFRKMALYTNSRGILVLPGGYGTLDELFELWAQRARDQHLGHLGVLKTEFWKPIMNALYDVGRRDRQLISEAAWDRLAYTDDYRKFIRSLPSAKTVRSNQEPIHARAFRMALEITHTVDALDNVDPAVTIVGGRQLKADDWVMGELKELASRLTDAGMPLRVGNPVNIARAVVEGARGAQVQGFVLEGEEHLDSPSLKVHAQQKDFIVHKELLTRRSQALVFAPGGLGTIASLFAVLTQIQTGKRPHVPIVLLDKSFWGPILKAANSQMLSEQRRYISEKDLGLIAAITDDARVAAEAIQGFYKGEPGMM